MVFTPQNSSCQFLCKHFWYVGLVLATSWIFVTYENYLNIIEIKEFMEVVYNLVSIEYNLPPA